MIGQTISHYIILEKLGEGGMGVVYKARDTRLDRIVALKFLPPHLTQSEEDKQRFIREAKAAAALNHPNICTVYSVEEYEEQQFISMEYVDGISLREEIEQPPQDKQGLSADTALSFAIQIAEALSEAHEKGIVHRDIKPENIMLDSKNRVRVMDFGLAKFKDAINITKDGSTVGTIAYMSPEQIQGDITDHRSDIFSFGIVLFEMLTGQTPFRGEHEAAMMYSIVHEDPVTVTTLNPQISQELAQIIYKAIDKDPENRFQSMEDVIRKFRLLEKAVQKTTSDLLSDKTPIKNPAVIRNKSARNVAIVAFLGLLVAGAVYVTIMDRSPDDFHGVPNRVAVVVFENQTGDPGLDPVGRMAADWLIQGLARTDIVDVVPSEISLTAYREDRPLQFNIDLISAETQANIIIAGSYYKQGDLLTISPRLFDVQRNRLLRTLDPIEGNIELPMEAVGLLQQRIMGALATDFDNRLERFAGMTVQPPSYRAYEAYLRGHAFFMNQRNFREAIYHYTVAFKTDPMFAAPMFWKAVAHLNLGEWSISDSLTNYIEDQLINNLIPSDRVMAGWLRATLDGNRRGAYEAARQAALIAPGSEYHYQWGYEALRMNRPREAINAFQTLDPESHIMQGWFPYWNRLCTAYHLLKDFEDELQCARGCSNAVSKYSINSAASNQIKCSFGETTMPLRS
jgi:serine/threonine protein kinase